MQRRRAARLVVGGMLAVAGCSGSQDVAPTQLSMYFARASFYDAPFPSDDLVTSGRTIDLSGLPDPDMPMLMEQARGLLATADGFAQTGAVFFRATAALDPTTLPDLAGSVASDAAVYLVAIDPAQPDYLVKKPIDIAYVPDGGPFGATFMLALLPLQGSPLGAGETYAAVVTTSVSDATGHALMPSDAMTALATGGTPDGLSGDALAHYQGAITALTGAGTDPSTIAGLAVFTTEHAAAGLDVVRVDALALTPPTISAPTPSDVFDDYCVFDAMISMPDYQTGTPPYTNDGGGWSYDATGKPIVDHSEMARVVFTIPKGPTPPGGWPLVLFVRTGGGGDRPLVDRGVCSTPDFTTPITPGSGPAMDLAQVGYAGVMVDGPLGGIRNPNGADEEFLIFNIENAAALRDNVRESAVELALFRHVVGQFTFDATSCPGAGQVMFDESHVAIMGHSMGAWIAPLVVATDPSSFGPSVLSGAGASFIANMLDKQKPIEVDFIIASLLDYPSHGHQIDRHDPGLSILQWAAEPADPQVYTPTIVHGTSPHSVLMIQGIVDHYILPSIANSTSLSLGLDEAGTAYDATNAELQGLDQPVLGPLLPLVGRAAIAEPVTGNISSSTTAVVVQHPADAIEDGHEVMFQTEPPKHQYRCFLQSWLTGTPTVPADGAELDPCN